VGYNAVADIYVYYVYEFYNK